MALDWQRHTRGHRIFTVLFGVMAVVFIVGLAGAACWDIAAAGAAIAGWLK